MLPREVPLEEIVVERRRLGLQDERVQSELGHRLERGRVLDRLLDVDTPGERPVRCDEGRRSLERIEPSASRTSRRSRRRFAARSRRGSRPLPACGSPAPARGSGRRGSCRSREARAPPAPTRSRSGSACARCRRAPRSGGRGRRAWACRRTAAVARDDVARLEVDDDDRLRPQLLVRNAARLDREHVLAAVDAAHVPEGEDDEPRADELAVPLEHPLLQFAVVGHRALQPVVSVVATAAKERAELATAHFVTAQLRQADGRRRLRDGLGSCHQCRVWRTRRGLDG